MPYLMMQTTRSLIRSRQTGYAAHEFVRADFIGSWKEMRRHPSEHWSNVTGSFDMDVDMSPMVNAEYDNGHVTSAAETCVRGLVMTMKKAQ